MNHWQTRRSMRARLAIFACALSLLAAACSDSDSGSDPSQPAAEPSATGEPQRGGRVVIGIADESALGFDPSTSAVGPGGRTIALAIFDTITAFDADGNLVPYLAASVEANDDATVWTVVLRDGVTFHDGTPLNAEAVKWTFDAHDTAGRPLAPGYATEVVDDLTVRFTFPEPYGTFEAAMATQFGWIKSPTAEQSLEEDFTNNPVGTGPYRLSEWVRDDHLTLVRYEDHWRTDIALLDEVVLRVIPDESVRRAALEAGDIDAMVVGSGDIAALRDASFQLVETSVGVNTIVLNNSVAPFDDIRVRRGLAHALDYQSIIDTVWDGVGQPATGPIPHDNPFYSAPSGYPSYDPDEAAGLISDYETETGTNVEFALTFLNDPVSQELAQLVQAYWQAAGADVELAPPVALTDLLNIYSTHEYEAGLYDIEGFLDPDIWSFYLFHSSSFLNLGAISIPEIDEGLGTGHQVPDVAERTNAYARFQQALADETPWIFLRDQVQAVATREGVNGVTGWTLPDGSAGIGKQFWLPFTVDSLWASS